jgi:hypothetical protein
MYDLYSLGWHSFQQLCLTITREILGQTVESFLDSSDAGRDGAFSGVWKPVRGEVLTGRFVVQCKFTSKHDKNLSLTDLAEEEEKVRRLVQEGRCDSYILMTNAGLSGSVSEDVEKLFKGVGVNHVLPFGSTWICDQIRESKRLRMLVPRVYGLGDLSQILDERAYSQAKALLASLREDLSKVVITSAYRKAAEALDKHSFVLLIGEPAAGKTTIASMLSMAALDQWGASTLKLNDSAKVLERWNPDEPSQFFWIDDAFGVLQYESDLVHGWNHALTMIKTMLRKGAKIVLTSRDYIYKRARNDLKEGAFPLLRESQVVIDVRDLTPEEKQQILYNHIKLGKQDREFRTDIKPYLPSIASQGQFVPETARRLADPLFTAELSLDRYHLHEFVEKQEQFLQEVLQGLDEDSKAALALIYMRNDNLESPIDLRESESQAIGRLGSSLGGCITALESLNGSLVQHIQTEEFSGWRFKHPTVGDAYAALLLQNPELLGIYLQGSPINQFTWQVTCGQVGLERAVALPKALFPLVLKRLDEFSSQTNTHKSPLLAHWYSQSRLDSFLATRCSKDFLAQYIEAHPDILPRTSDPGLMLNSVTEVDLAVRLNELGLLPEEHRKKFVNTVTAYALNGEDLYALESHQIQSVFTSVELADFRERVRNELVPKLSDVRQEWESNYSSDGSPDEHIEPLLSSFSALKEEFADDPAILTQIEREIRFAQSWISDHTPDDSGKKRPERTFGEVDAQDQPPILHRGIFDDVDE